jgi:hypothetical protein
MGCMASRAAKSRMTVAWSSLGGWQALKLDLQLEAEAVFAASGEVIAITPDSESGSTLTLESGRKSLKITCIPQGNAVRWDREKEYSFERITDDTAELERKLVQRLRRL